LSIARNAVQRQGGRLWAENTTVGLRLNMRLVAEVDGVNDDAFAAVRRSDKPAPTGDMGRPQIV